jgi:predicted dienelactone hydrolase
MKRSIIAIAIALATSTLASTFGANAQDRPGFATFVVGEPGRTNPMQAALWYPARRPGRDGKQIEIGNAVFRNVPLQQDAEITPGRLPVVLLSHGLGGNYRSLTWLAAGLAERGAIVIAVNHPLSTTADVRMPAAFDHWTRVRDLKDALATIERDPRFASSIDQRRIFAAGFSFGGWTALSIAGVQANIEGFARYCGGRGKDSTHCTDIARWGVDLNTLAPETWNASYKDDRIKAVAAIDPAFTFGIGPEGIARVSASVLLIGLGEGRDRLPATDFSSDGSGFGDRFSAARKMVIAPASHFTMLPVCNAEGPAILAEEKDDPVCTDPPGTDRATIHRKIIEALGAHFEIGSGKPNQQSDIHR